MSSRVDTEDVLRALPYAALWLVFGVWIGGMVDWCMVWLQFGYSLVYGLVMAWCMGVWFGYGLVMVMVWLRFDYGLYSLAKV